MLKLLLRLDHIRDLRHQRRERRNYTKAYKHQQEALEQYLLYVVVGDDTGENEARESEEKAGDGGIPGAASVRELANR